MLVLTALLALTQSSVTVGAYWELRQALASAKPGTTVYLKPGEYSGGFQVENLQGAPGKPIVIAGQDPKNPPKILNGGIHLVASSYVEIRDLYVVGTERNGNGINVDDGGVREKPSHHITLRRITSTDFGTPISCGIKMAGVNDFAILDCDVRNYDEGIDLVGCHDGLIENCRLEKGGGVGVQAKGASARVTVRQCKFKDFGERGVNMGGSTGDPFFRPPFETIAAGKRYESKDIRVEGCTFEGGTAPVAYINSDGAVVRYNTIVNPSRWAIRILQETPRPDFHPSRNGTFSRNIVVFRSDRWFEGGVNIGPNTAPSTFKFEDNFWFCVDRVERSNPSLPTVEARPIIGRDPQLTDWTKATSPSSREARQWLTGRRRSERAPTSLPNEGARAPRAWLWVRHRERFRHGFRSAGGATRRTARSLEPETVAPRLRAGGSSPRAGPRSRIGKWRAPARAGVARGSKGPHGRLPE
ncbi:MAG: right-handed parallel beta-helix repeat-containing protein [Fimbriimonas sp.]